VDRPGSEAFDRDHFPAPRKWPPTLAGTHPPRGRGARLRPSDKVSVGVAALNRLGFHDAILGGAKHMSVSTTVLGTACCR
jgi:hypothetical protein